MTEKYVRREELDLNCSRDAQIHINKDIALTNYNFSLKLAYELVRISKELKSLAEGALRGA